MCTGKTLAQSGKTSAARIFGCGFSTIALGDGVIDIAGVVDVLKDRKEILMLRRWRSAARQRCCSRA